MIEAIAPVKCFKCTGDTFDCPCHACPKCDAMLCATCPIKTLPIEHEYATHFGTVSSSIRRDVPIPPHSGPWRCFETKDDAQIEVVKESSFFRQYQSEELIWDDARIVAGALKTIFFFCFAGVVAGSAAVMFAAAAVFSGEVPE